MALLFCCLPGALYPKLIDRYRAYKDATSVCKLTVGVRGDKTRVVREEESVDKTTGLYNTMDRVLTSCIAPIIRDA